MNLSGSSRRSGRIFESCDISIQNMPTVSLDLVMYLRSDSAMPRHAFAYAITANGVCLHLLPPSKGGSLFL